MRHLASTAVTGTVLVLGGLLAGCGGGPSAEDLAAVDYTPVAAEGWEVSDPAEHDLDPDAVTELYWRAGQLESIYSLLVVTDGDLVGEEYFHGGRPEQLALMQSAAKSITGAMVGIAIEEGCLPGVDQPMMTYFPELADRLDDPRKNDITIEQLLAHRAGYAWEESSTELLELLYQGFLPDQMGLVEVPLVRDPGSGHDYSNLSSHLLSVIVSRACEVDLLDFATEHLFDPLGIEPGDWTQDWDGYRWGGGELHLRARDMARFGQLYLDDGAFDGEQVVPAAWVEDSWTPYTEGAWHSKVGDNFERTAYGYQWWIIDAGPHTYYLAWGHGGQQIAVLPELDMVVVVTADPLFGDHGGSSWSLEKANLNLVADFIAGLPPA
jgi:CubicO group peptidase (beta-lactamase class C family)